MNVATFIPRQPLDVFTTTAYSRNEGEVIHATWNHSWNAESPRSSPSERVRLSASSTSGRRRGDSGCPCASIRFQRARGVEQSAAGEPDPSDVRPGLEPGPHASLRCAGLLPGFLDDPDGQGGGPRAGGHQGLRADRVLLVPGPPADWQS